VLFSVLDQCLIKTFLLACPARSKRIMAKTMVAIGIKAATSFFSTALAVVFAMVPHLGCRFRSVTMLPR